MKTHSIADAEHFVSSLRLTDIPQYRPHYFAKPAPSFTPDAGQDQAVVVASGLQAFAKGIDEDTRRAVNNAMLLAQLVAKQKAHSDLHLWYQTYFDTLSEIGWLIENQTVARFSTQAIQTDVHNAVLKIAAALVGPATTAFELIRVSLEAIEKVGEESPASPSFTIFNRETQHRDVSTFQVSVVEPNPIGGLAVALMGMQVSATTTVTQVLFLKFRSEEAKLEHASAKIELNAELVARLAKAIQEKVGAYADGYIAGLKIEPIR